MTELGAAPGYLMAMACRGGKAGVIINEHVLTASQTRAHVDSLSRWFDFIGHDELPEHLERRGKRPFCLLTFDDGKRSNATEVAPQLKRLGVPAVFYVTTRCLSEGAALWFDRYAALVRKLGYAPPGLEAGTVKQLPAAILHERLNRACAQYGVTPDLECEDIRPMSWEQARRLHADGFTIGAHGLRHAILTNEPEAAALAEIEESMAEVSARLEVPCTTFAFPNGNYTPRLAEHASRSGARTVMTTEPMWVDAASPLRSLPRIQLFGSFSRARTELKLALAATGWILANPDGTGRAYRRAH